jgi:hypothetical protein
MMLGLSVLAPRAIFIAVMLLTIGLLNMLAGMIAAMLELKAALQPAELESRFVSDMLQQEEHRPGDTT